MSSAAARAGTLRRFTRPISACASRSSIEPVWHPASVEDEGAFEPRLLLPLSLSYDHRVIDGADAARFLRWICEAFEQPFVLAL